jgi:hypothetical protein
LNSSAAYAYRQLTVRTEEGLTHAVSCLGVP